MIIIMRESNSLIYINMNEIIMYSIMSHSNMKYESQIRLLDYDNPNLTNA